MIGGVARCGESGTEISLNLLLLAAAFTFTLGTLDAATSGARVRIQKQASSGDVELQSSVIGFRPDDCLHN